MKIDIIKKEDGEIVFCIDKEEYKFEYEALDKLIERVYNNDAETTEELKEYEELLKGIVTGARKEDYREAVRKAKEASEKLESEEQNEII